jgi:hypothetical protein
MQMIDVLKRLAELDETNPNVAKPTMTTDQSLVSVSNAETAPISESIAECGPMGISSMDKPSTPATFSINASAGTGDEVSSMLRDIMNLAGVKSSVGGDADLGVELGSPSPAEPADDMANMIGMIDKMNTGDSDADPKADSDNEEILGALAGGALGAAAGGPMGALTGAAAGDSLTDPDNDETKKESPVARMADEVRDMTSELAQEAGAEYDNSPEQEIQAHKYGDDQVSPKPQGLKQRLGDNPYKPVGESTDPIQQMSLSLLKAYEEFKKQ